MFWAEIYKTIFYFFRTPAAQEYQAKHGTGLHYPTEIEAEERRVLGTTSTVPLYRSGKLPMENPF
jgi:hypothetical protein